MTQNEKTMKVDERELLIIYNPEIVHNKALLTKALALSNHVKQYKISDAMIPETMWHEILEKLEEKPIEFMDTSHKYFQDNLEGKDLSNADWYNVLTNAPFLLRAPIVVVGEKAIICYNATDFGKLYQEDRPYMKF